MNSQIQSLFLKRLLMPFCFSFCMLMLYIPAHAQEKPPKPIKVTVDLVQNLNFGTFCYGNGSGTTVIIYPNGSRSSTGNIVLINSSFSAALYRVKAIPGTLITLANGHDAILTGSNGGTLVMKIGTSQPLSPFIATGGQTMVTIGGTLTVGTVGDNPAGAYSGTYDVTFIQE